MKITTIRDKLHNFLAEQVKKKNIKRLKKGNKNCYKRDI